MDAVEWTLCALLLALSLTTAWLLGAAWGVRRAQHLRTHYLHDETTYRGVH
jgi:hypothetical protein